MKRKAAWTFLVIHLSAFVVMAILLAATALIECVFFARRVLAGARRPAHPLPARMAGRRLGTAAVRAEA